jgi:ubiquinone/menaquinone biosynthesis C-methylase UbiE
MNTTVTDTPTTTAPGDPLYFPGRTDAETQRLMHQAELYDAITRRFFHDAGITPGMRVLDVGSGAGDVAFLAADLVGPTGSVVGVDLNPQVLATACRRAEAERRVNVTFLAADYRSLDMPEAFDAVVGRLVLMYAGDPAEALRSLLRCLRPGGIVAFQETEIPPVFGLLDAAPVPLTLLRQVWTWVDATFRRAGCNPSMGPVLYRAFQAAGLGIPHMLLQSPLGCAPEMFDYAAASLRSILPLIEQAGIATAAEVDVDTLAERLAAEIHRARVPVVLGPQVTAWARKPTV